MFSLFLILFRPISAWNEPFFVFLLFFEFFTIFLEFSITLRVGTKRNDNFYFLSFPAFSNLFWLIMKPHWYFLILWFFLLFFWNFLQHIGQERNGTIFLFSLFLSLFQPILDWNEAVMVFFKFFLIFLLFFFGIFYYTNGTERNDNFYFLSFPTFSSLHWLKMK